MTQVTDDLPGKKNTQEIDEAAIKAQLIAEHEAKEVRDTNFPTEIIDLPSKGLLYPEGHPLASGQIEMKYMTAKEEDILASPNLIKQGVVIDKLLKSLIVTPINYDDLLIGDKNAIMVAARVLGYGKDYNVDVTCKHCSESNEVNVDLTEITDKNFDEGLIQKGVNEFVFTLPTSKRTITFKLLTHGDEKALDAEIKGLKSTTARTGIDRELSTRLKYIITSIDGNSDKNYIRSFVDNELFSLDSRALREYIKKVQPDTDMHFSFTCNECSEYNERIPIPINVQFFWPGV